MNALKVCMTLKNTQFIREKIYDDNIISVLIHLKKGN